MASDRLSPVPESDRYVRRRPHVLVHLAATAADRDDAGRLDTMAEYHGYEHRHRDSGRHHDPAGRLWAIPPYTSSDHGSGGFHRCLAVLCSTPVRGHLLVPRRGLEFSRGCASWQFPLLLAGYFALVHGKHWRSPHPSLEQSNSLLSVA